jgi:hypothetical protein
MRLASTRLASTRLASTRLATTKPAIPSRRWMSTGPDLSTYALAVWGTQGQGAVRKSVLLSSLGIKCSRPELNWRGPMQFFCVLLSPLCARSRAGANRKQEYRYSRSVLRGLLPFKNSVAGLRGKRRKRYELIAAMVIAQGESFTAFSDFTSA